MAPDCAYWTLIRTTHGWLTELAGKGDRAPLTALLPAGERACGSCRPAIAKLLPAVKEAANV